MRSPRLTATLLLVTLLPLIGCQQKDSAAKSSPRSVSPPPVYPAELTAKFLGADCEQNLAVARATFEQLEHLPEPYTVDTLLKPTDRLMNSVNNDTGMVFLMSNVHPDEAVQTAADTCVQDFSRLLTDIGLSRELYQRFSQVNTEGLDPQARRFHARMMRDFKRFGVSLDASTRDVVRDINDRIIELGQEFSKNIRADARSIQVPASGLQGLPEDYQAAHPLNDQGLATITIEYPDLFPFLRYSHDDQARKALYEQHLNRAFPANEAVLKSIIEQRDTLSKLLGYNNFADYATEIMMVKDAATVETFIDRITLLAQPRAESDYQSLLKVLRQQYPDATEVDSWRKFYAEELVRQQDYDIDTKAVRQYFQYGNVKRGIFELVEDLFGVEIKPWQTTTWHASVEPYAIWENGQPIGYFYLDMHPRERKYNHAAQFDIQSGIIGEQKPIAALVCNFPGENDPSELMEHKQVETFLHEFGHLLHHIFSGQQHWAMFSGVVTERDFVEAPSQLLEEWIWDFETLKRFAVNKQGEVIPESLVEKMRNARDFARGTHIQNQMFYAALSLSYYQIDPNTLDLTATLKDRQHRYSPFPYVEDTHFFANFGHLYGYSAAYYTYMWSEVIAADILREFRQQGMRNRNLADRYRRTILAPGGSRDAAQLVEDFLGRPFSFNAFADQLNTGTSDDQD